MVLVVVNVVTDRNIGQFSQEMFQRNIIVPSTH